MANSRERRERYATFGRRTRAQLANRWEIVLIFIIVAAGIVITTIAAIKAKERSDLEALLTETRSIKDDPIRKPSEVKIDSDNYFGESTQVGVNVTSFNETKTKITTTHKNDFDDYVDLVPDYDAEYDVMESNSNPVTSRIGDIIDVNFNPSNHYLNHRYPGESSDYDINLPGYSAPNGSNPNSNNVQLNKQADLAADGSGFEIDPTVQSSIKSPSSDHKSISEKSDATKVPLMAVKLAGKVKQHNHQQSVPSSIPQPVSFNHNNNNNQQQPMLIRSRMFVKPSGNRLGDESNTHLDSLRPSVLYTSLDDQLLSFSSEHNVNGKAIQGLNGEFNSHPHYPHLAPNMIIRDDSMDFFRKISQPHQAISMMPRSNNPGSFINIDQLNTAENGLFVAQEKSNLDQNVHLPSEYRPHQKPRRHFGMPSVNRITRVKRSLSKDKIVEKMREKKDFNRNLDQSQESSQLTTISSDSPSNHSLDITSKDLKSSASGYFSFNDEGRHQIPILNLNPYNDMLMKRPYAMQSRSPHRKRQISAYFPNSLQTQKHSYGMLGSGNFEVIRGGILSEDDRRSSTNSYMDHMMMKRPRSTINDYDYNDGYNNKPNLYSSEEYFANNPILGFQGYENFKAASQRKSVKTLNQDADASDTTDNPSSSSSRQVHVFVDHELMAAS